MEWSSKSAVGIHLQLQFNRATVLDCTRPLENELSNRRNPRHEGGILRVLGHSTRLPILETLQLRDAKPAELAAMLGVPVTTVAFDCTKLAEAGLIARVHTEPETGERVYRGSPRSVIGHSDWLEMPPSIRGSVLCTGMEAFMDEMAYAFKAGTISGCEDTVFNWMPIRVDRFGRGTATEILGTMFTQLRMVQDQSEQRLRALEEDGTTMIVGCAGFEAADASPESRLDDEIG
jgi:hypothetical protein